MIPDLPNRKQVGKLPVEGDEEPVIGPDGAMYLRGTLIPDKFKNLMSNPYGDLNTSRDLKQRKKVASLKAIHERARIKASRISHMTANPEEEKRKEIGRRRVTRVSEMVRDALEDTLREFKEKNGASESSSMVMLNTSGLSIDGVEMTRDLKRAKVLWSLWGDTHSPDKVAEVIQKESVVKRLRKMVSSRIGHLKWSPELVFVRNEVPQRIKDVEEQLDILEESLSPQEVVKRRIQDKYERESAAIMKRMMDLEEKKRNSPLARTPSLEEIKRDKRVLKEEKEKELKEKVEWDTQTNSTTLSMDDREIRRQMRQMKNAVQREMGPIRRAVVNPGLPTEMARRKNGKPVAKPTEEEEEEDWEEEETEKKPPSRQQQQGKKVQQRDEWEEEEPVKI